MNLIKYENDKFYVVLSELEHLALCEQLTYILNEEQISSYTFLDNDDLIEIIDIFKEKSPTNTYEVPCYTFNSLLDYLITIPDIGCISEHKTTLYDLKDMAWKIILSRQKQ